ncbi:MAG: hypothetical protein K0Q52_1668 [Microbacterium sp.]|jgi:hypothetical protein|nr:hypothetical protein [Microbacterium sp.]
MKRSSGTRLRGALATAVVAAAIAVSIVPAASAAAATTEHDWFVSPDGTTDYAQSAAAAYEFLDDRVDEYCSADGMCLPRSYQGGFFSTPTWEFTSSFLYDDALTVMAYAARGLPDDIRRARSIGDAMLFVQANDPDYTDGRTRASYQPGSLREGAVEIGSPASFTGNQAWVGMALARLFDITGEQKYLDGAVRLGEWIETNTADTVRAPFGYTGGQDAEGTSFTFKATEHNIDVTAFFTQLATLTGDTVWADRAAIAEGFIAAMQAEDGHLWTGTNPDGVTTNYYPTPEDPQAWSYLATLDDRYSSSLTWTVANLHAVDGPYEGPSFSSADVSKVWFEGSGQLALALRTRGGEGDTAYVQRILSSVELAQRQAVNGDGRGIVASSSDGLDTGFGDLYYASLHTGATSWYLLALTGDNPFRLPVDAEPPTTPGTGTPITEPVVAEGAGEALAESGSATPVGLIAGAAALTAVSAVLLPRRRRARG